MLITEALDILAARVDEIDGLTVTTDPRLSITVPHCLIHVPRVDYDVAMVRGGMHADIELRVFVSEADTGEGFKAAREYMSGHGVQSIRQAAETQLGGDALQLKVVIDAAELEPSDNYLMVVYSGKVHIPGAVAS